MCEFLFNPLIPKNDQHLISLYNITTVSNIKVKRIKEMITSQRSSWLFNKFSLDPWILGKCIENIMENGEFSQWSQGEKG